MRTTEGKKSVEDKEHTIGPTGSISRSGFSCKVHQSSKLCDGAKAQLKGSPVGSMTVEGLTSRQHDRRPMNLNGLCSPFLLCTRQLKLVTQPQPDQTQFPISFQQH